MKFITLASLLIVCHQITNAQQNFIPGSIITSNGDSLSGSIDYRDWKKTPEHITFKNSNGVVQTFTADAIKGFYIIPAGETYISQSLQIDMTPDDPDKVLAETIIAPVVIEKAIFMQQLLKSSSVSIYQYTDQSNKVHFFYIKENEKPVELIHRYLFSQVLQKIQHDTKYREQLADLAASCNGLSKKTINLKYSETQIQQFFTQYLNCINPTTAVEVKKRVKLPVKFGVLAGVMFNTYKFVGDNDIAYTNYSSYTSPVAGVLLDIGLSRSYDKLHIVNELIYKRNKTSNTFPGYLTTGFTYQRGLAFDFSYLQVNTMLRYILSLSPTVKPYINAGIGNAGIVYEKKNTMYTKYSTGYEEFGKGIDGERKYEFSILAGAGVEVRNMSLELRYGYAKKSFSPYQNLDIRTGAAQVIAAYKF